MDDTLALLEQTGAILDGHFLLSSGLHSPRYVQCALVLQYPDKAAWLGERLAERFRSSEVQAVMAPAIGGILVAHEVARALGVRAIFAERRQGQMQLRRGFTLAPGERVVIVEDVVTTGESLNEVIQIAHDQGATVVGVGALLNRGQRGPFPFGLSLQALVTLEIPVYQPTECPFCQQGLPFTAPGTRRAA
ncbi:MAG: orotate phosphoribosyltransferase [Acidobacteria bacterium]|nr:orotate phosphoribosyltransferase [Acidobacteriota bacterium]